MNQENKTVGEPIGYVNAEWYKYRRGTTTLYPESHPRIATSPLYAAPQPSQPVEAGETVLPAWFGAFLTNVCEIPDRNSPEDEPDAIVATLEELKSCALNAIEAQGESASCTVEAAALRAFDRNTKDGGSHDCESYCAGYVDRHYAASSAVVLDDERAALQSIIDAGRNAKPRHEGGIGENTVYLTPDMYMALSQAPSLAFESALAELVNKIDTGLDSGDLLVDARRASSAIDSILSGGDLVAYAHEYFRDSGDRYEKSIEFRIGWDACLDAIVQARAASPQATATRTHTTQAGESVMGIALRQCGDEAEWRHILACNPKFADMLPHEYFPIGTVLTLPPATGVDHAD